MRDKLEQCFFLYLIFPKLNISIRRSHNPPDKCTDLIVHNKTAPTYEKQETEACRNSDRMDRVQHRKQGDHLPKLQLPVVFESNGRFSGKIVWRCKVMLAEEKMTSGSC